MSATLMPEGNHFKIFPAEAVIDEIANTAEVQATNLLLARVFDLRSNAGLFDQDGQRGLEVFGDGAGCSRSVLAPPRRGVINVPLREQFDSYTQRQGQPYLRSRSNISSAEIPSCRSASSKASTSSASAAGVRRIEGSASLAKTVTKVPSGNDRFSRTTLPLTTLPVATCMAQWYSATGRLGGVHALNGMNRPPLIVWWAAAWIDEESHLRERSAL